MKIFLLTQSEDTGYDSYDSAVVIAEDEEQAKHSCVCGFHKYHDGKFWFEYADGRQEKEGEEDQPVCSGWALPKHITVKYIGEAKEGSEQGVVCSSYNAG